MGLFRNRGGIAGKVLGIMDKGADIAKEAVTDKDKLNELQYTLMQARAELMLGGKGGQVTKYTICFLVSLVVGCLCFGFMFPDAGMMTNALDFSRAATPVIAVLIGVYGGSKTVQKVFRERNGNGRT